MKADTEARAETEQGETPIHVAARKGHLALLEFLHKAGANPGATDRYGTRPKDWAARRGHHDALAYLEALPNQVAARPSREL